MTDDRDDEVTPGPEGGGIDEDPPIYRSGRVRIIGAEPAGTAVPEEPAATGALFGADDELPLLGGDGLDDALPADEPDLEMPHWNDAPTGQVPAILDRGTGDESTVAPPSWREEETDWAAHEELFEPSMLSNDLPAVGSMVNDNNEAIDVDRQPWHFDDEDLPSDEDTLVIASPLADFGSTYEPKVEDAPSGIVSIIQEDVAPPPDASVRGVPPTPVAPAASTAAASRLRPPEPPSTSPRTSALDASSGQWRWRLERTDAKRHPRP